MKWEGTLLLALTIVFLSVSAISPVSLAVDETANTIKQLTQEGVELVQSFLLDVMRWSNITSMTELEFPFDYRVSGIMNESYVQATVRFDYGVVIGYELESYWDYPYNKTLEECRELALGMLLRYGELFNMTVDSPLISLMNATLTEEGFEFIWSYYNLGNYTLDIPLPKFKVETSKSGLIVDFWNYPHHIASSIVNVSREEAIAIAEPYAESYAQENDRSIVSIGATLILNCDVDLIRGTDNNALYPVWIVEFKLDPRNDTLIYGYHVSIWADTGEVWIKSELCKPIGYVAQQSQHWKTALIVIALIWLAMLGTVICKRRRW